MGSPAAGRKFSRDAGLGALTLALLGVISVFYPRFALPSNLSNLLDDTSILIILALAQMAVILTRAVDLSVAANLALTGMCVALFNHAHPEAGLYWVIILAVAIGTTLGA